MKKSLFCLLLIICCCSLCFVGCKSSKNANVNVKSISATYNGNVFTQNGDTITTTYNANNLSVTKNDFNFSVTLSDGTNRKLSDNDILYDVTYSTTVNDSKKTNAGTYEIEFKYKGITKKVNIVVEKATVDMSNVGWIYNPSTKITGDGTTKTIELFNWKQDGIEKVTYTGNSAIDAGKYTATASFKVNSNYYPVEDMTIEWEII